MNLKKDDHGELHMKGTLYGVGVGPGDPELITLKAIRTIRNAKVIACPGKDALQSAAYKIASRAVPELKEKELLAVPMPMTKDPEELAKAHRNGAARIEAVLDSGRDLAFLTLGDPSIYSTFTYLRRIVQEDGYPTCTVSGVPSFCAAAAALQIPLAEWDEELHIIPAAQEKELPLSYPGSYVLMKSGTQTGRIKALLKDSGKTAYLAENCGMPEETLCKGLSEFPDTAGYFSLVIVKD